MISKYTGFALLKLSDIELTPTESFGLPIQVHDLSSTRCADDQTLADSLGLEGVGWVLVRPDGHTMATG